MPTVGTMPSYVGSSALAVATTGTVACTRTCTVGNVIFLQVVADGNGQDYSLSSITNVASIEGTASAVSNVALLEVMGSSVARYSIWLARVTAAAVSITLNVGASGDDLYGAIHEFQNVSGSNRVFNGVLDAPIGGAVYSATAGVTNTTLTYAARTANGPNRLACVFINVNDDNQASWDTETFSPATGGTFVARSALGSATGTDAALGLQTANMPDGGTITGGTITMASDSHSQATVMLRPEEIPVHPAANHQNPALLMEGLKRNWNRLRSGLIVPDRDMWVPS
jgi:hypothetical protein